MKTKTKYYKRQVSTVALHDLIEEATRVNYTVKWSHPLMRFKITTDECENHPAGETVFLAYHRDDGKGFDVKFNAAYWQPANWLA